MRQATVRVWCALLVATGLVNAYPKYWYNSKNIFGDVQAIVEKNCDAHPFEEIRSGKDINSRAPVKDSNIAFVFRNGHVPVKTLCPGTNYTLSLSLSQEGLALLSANSSSITFLTPTPTNAVVNCPNRVHLGNSVNTRASANFNVSFDVPCSLAGQYVRFQVTTAASGQQVSPWRQSSITVGVSTGASCGTYADSTTRLTWAISDKDRLEKHSAWNKGGFTLQRRLSAEESQPGTGSPTPKVSFKEELPPPPPESTAPSCPPSSLGYACSVDYKQKLTIHWSVNTSNAPANLCTPANMVAVTESDLAKYGTLHMAVQSNVRGYVALGFNPTEPGEMFPADIALGWVRSDGSTSFNTYFAEDEDLEEDDVVSPSWAYDGGVVHDASTGTTTICFSRRLLDDLAKTSNNLIAASEGDGASPSRRRLLSDAAEGSLTLSLIWAVSNSAGLVQHMSSNVGDFMLDTSSGIVEADEADGQYWINVHGALMAVSWGLLLPLGTLLPAHRWLLGSAKVGSKALWFLLHLFFQWTGVALFVAGFVVAYVKFGDVEGESLVEAHRDIGIAIMAAAGAQVVFAFVRPNPEHPRRGLWNLMHHNLGRATVLLAWANVYIGIVVNHMDNEVAYTAWVIPIAIVMGILLLATLVLRFLGPSGAADEAVTATSTESTSGLMSMNVEVNKPVS